MKTKFIVLVFLVIAVYLFSSCDSDSSTNGSTGETVADATYYPAGDGTSYKYNVDKVDSNNNQTVGNRSSRYSGTTVFGGVIYQVQIDSLTLSGLTVLDSAFFWKTETGVFFFLDTTGLSESLPSDISITDITFDHDMRAFIFPINEQSNWTVFKMNITVQGFTFTPVEVAANFTSKESLTLNLTSGDMNVEAVKIRFTLTIRLSPFSAGINYQAFAWIAKDIGIVKWEGNGTIINAFTGGGIVFADTSSTVIQTLVEYDVN